MVTFTQSRKAANASAVRSKSGAPGGRGVTIRGLLGAGDTSSSWGATCRLCSVCGTSLSRTVLTGVLDYMEELS